MRTVRRVLVAATLLSLSVSAEAQSMRHCRAKPQLLELGAPLPIAREAVTELKHLRIVTLGSSSAAAYGVSNPVYAYPTQLNIGLEKALPGVNVEVLNRVIGDQDVEHMAARKRAAESGSLLALFLLAETYDPAMLSAWGIFGRRSNVTKARELYAKAVAAGVHEAKYRLTALR